MTLTKWKSQNFIIGGVNKFFDEDFPLLRWKPFRDIDRIFDEDFPAFSTTALSKLGFDLACDIYEKNGNIIAEMNIPGIDPGKIKISVEDNYLKVSGSREEKKDQK